MKTTIKIALGCLVAVALIPAAMWWNRKHNEKVCVNQMRQWDSAAESYCLANNLGPTNVLTLDELAPYTYDGKKSAVCPCGGPEYAPFTVANGPVCPNGHNIAPGEPRPFRATYGEKLLGIYAAAGWTNLIDLAKLSDFDFISAKTTLNDVITRIGPYQGWIGGDNNILWFRYVLADGRIVWITPNLKTDPPGQLVVKVEKDGVSAIVFPKHMPEGNMQVDRPGVRGLMPR